MSKIYVANEGEGTVSVIDLQDNLKVTITDINDNSGEMFMNDRSSCPYEKSLKNY